MTVMRRIFGSLLAALALVSWVGVCNARAVCLPDVERGRAAMPCHGGPPPESPAPAPESGCCTGMDSALAPAVHHVPAFESVPLPLLPALAPTLAMLPGRSVLHPARLRAPDRSGSAFPLPLRI